MERFAEPILHVDMDAFFVEVERLADPSLVGKPVIVGGLGRRGVVASASYEAREANIRSAMPMAEARKRCPHGRFVAPSHRRYGEVSEAVFEVLRSITPLVEGLSVDEAFLDVSGLRLHYPSAEAIGTSIRQRLREDVGLPASVGIASTKFLAKMASEDAKPDGLLCVPCGGELAYLHPLPVRRLWGVGEATHAALEGLGIRTIGDLASAPAGLLERHLGASLGGHLTALAGGIDVRSVEPGGGAKSVSVEETYERDLGSEDAILSALLNLCHRLDARLRRSGHRGSTVQLKARFADFETVTRSISVDPPAAHATQVWEAAQVLWDRVPRSGRGIRLLGVGVTGLVDRAAPLQLSIDDDGRTATASAVDDIRSRFGDDAVLPARLIVARPEDAAPQQSERNHSGD